MILDLEALEMSNDSRLNLIYKKRKYIQVILRSMGDRGWTERLLCFLLGREEVREGIMLCYHLVCLFR